MTRSARTFLLILLSSLSISINAASALSFEFEGSASDPLLSDLSREKDGEWVECKGNIGTANVLCCVCSPAKDPQYYCYKNDLSNPSLHCPISRDGKLCAQEIDSKKCGATSGAI